MPNEPIFFPPWKIKMVEPIQILSRREREEAIKRAGYNTFNLRSDEVMIDLISDSGTNAISTRQYADAILASESVNTRALKDLHEAVQEVYNKTYCLTFHQGRAAERLIFDALTGRKKYIIGNSYFLTTLEFARRLSLEWHDLIVEEAYRLESPYPFKGNMDLEKLQATVREYGSENIAFVRMEANVNIIGGQPVSLENIRELRKIADGFGLMLVLDATLLSENAYFIWEREFDFQPDFSPAKIVRMIADLFDIIYVSSKRDHIAPSGGLLIANDPAVFERLKTVWELYEGIGVSGRDIAMIAQGIKESMDERYLASRIRQVQDFGSHLLNLGLPVCLPLGGHAVHLDAKKFVPHLKSDQFPAQSLAAAYYVESGVRAMEMGSVALGVDSSAKRDTHPELEMLRLAIPRRVYTKEHLDYAASALKRTWEERASIKGLKMMYDPGVLRSFKARFDIKKVW